jgi:hypothetical protein
VVRKGFSGGFGSSLAMRCAPQACHDRDEDCRKRGQIAAMTGVVKIVAATIATASGKSGQTVIAADRGSRLP